MIDPLLDKTPPHNIGTEESVLSSLFIDNKGFEEISLNPQDFYKSAHQKIFSAMLALRSKKDPVDLTTVAHYLQDNNLLEEIGGASFLASISDSAPVANNVTKYAKDIKSLAVRREIITKASNILEKAISREGTCDEVLSYAQTAMLDIQNTNVTDNIEPIEKALFSHLDTIEKYQTENMPEGFGFGLPFMDKILRVIGSKLIIIAARPAIGKTAFALSAARHIAQNYQTKVAILSLEMDKEPLIDRLLSVDADINHMKFYNKNALKQDDWSKLSTSVSVLSRLPLYIDDSGRNIEDVKRICRKLKKEGFGIIFIDQLSKIPGVGKDTERYTRNCNEIALLKKEIKLPIVLLAQLRRSETQNEPTLDTLKQTGALEEDADIVIFIHRPYGKDKTVNPNQVKIICAKNRQGAEGFDEGMYFKANRGMFALGDYMTKRIEKY